MGIVNPDLAEEREKCNFDKDEMCQLLIGNDAIDHIKKIEALCKKYPALNSGVEYYEMSRTEQILEWWRRYKLVMETDDLHHLFTQHSSNP